MEKVLKSQSLFQLIDRKKFNALVEKWGMDKGVRTFSTWEMTQTLLHCFILRLGSFREAEGALGIPDSTLGDSLRKRSYGFFQELCDLILMEIRSRTESRKVKKAIRTIMAIDSSEISVHGSLFSKPGWKKKYTVGHKAGAKIHVIWNVDGEWIDDFLVTPGRRGDSPVSLNLRILPNKTYVFDRAYNDFDFWKKIVEVGSDFVTRLKDCARHRKQEREILDVNPNKVGILSDKKFKSTSLSAKKSRIRLRHIIYKDPETKKIFHFVTSDKNAPAKAVAEIYKRRWAIELLFRWLKGHLDIRYLPTKTTNSVKVQLAVAVLIQLLLQLKKLVDKFTGTLWDLLRGIRIAFIQGTLVKWGSPAGCRWSSTLEAPLQP